MRLETASDAFCLSFVAFFRQFVASVRIKCFNGRILDEPPVRTSFPVFASTGYLRVYCAIWCVLALSASVRAEDKVVIRDVGIDGYFAVGRMSLMQTDVTLENAAEVVVRVSAPDPQGNIAYFSSPAITVEAKRPQSVVVPFQSGQLGAPLGVDVLVDDKVVASDRRVLGENSGMLSPGITMVGMLGKPQGLPQWFNASRIVIPFADSKRRATEETDRTEAEASALATEVMQKIQSDDGAFEQLRSEYSEATESLGIFTEDSDTADVVAALRAVAIGSNGGPFKIGQSYQILHRDRLPDDVIAEQQNGRIFLDLDPQQLPDNAAGLAALDALIIARDYTLSPQQVSAISEWVRYGGHLLVSVGDDVDSYLKSPLSKQFQEWVPIEDQTSRLAELPGFTSFTDSQTAIAIPTGQPVLAARIGRTSGVTLVSGSDGPLVEQVRVGFGRLTLIGVDIVDGPVAKWAGLPILLRRLVFDEKRVRGRGETIQSEAIGHNGITDFSTQLHASATSFPSVKRPSSWIAMALMLIYLIAIGPLDYLIVHRLLKRPRLTWVTFPLMVIAGCAVGIWLADSANGKKLLLNQTSIVDLDVSTTTSYRVRSWNSLYSPDARRAELSVVPSDELVGGLDVNQPSPSPLLWTGIAENVFGGMLRSGGASLGSVAYRVDDDSVDGMPIPVWSTGNLETDWRGETKSSSEPVVEVRLTTTSAGKLKGSVKHNFPFPVKNWIVAHGLLAYYPRDAADKTPEIRPGQVWSPQSPRVRSRDLESYLTGVRIVHVERKMGEGGDDTKQSRQDYDALELDPGYCLRILSLHDAAGGTKYTGLTNHLLQDMDLTRLIDLNTAILFGEIDIPVATVSLDGTEVKPTRSRTFVRIMLPVERSERSRR